MSDLIIRKRNLRKFIYDVSLNDFKDKNKTPYMGKFLIARNAIYKSVITNSWMDELRRGRELSRKRTIRKSKFNK